VRLQVINDNYFIDGRKVTIEEYRAAFDALPSKLDELFGHEAMTDNPAGWPLVSESFAVPPGQIEKQMASDKLKGAPLTRYDELGRQIFESRGHRKAYLKALGLVDLSSFTGY
jgi:hypothetical protein